MRQLRIAVVVIVAGLAQEGAVAAQSDVVFVPGQDWQQAPAPPQPPQGGTLRRKMPAPGVEPAIAMPHHPGDLGKWWKNTEIVKELGLTDQQVSQIEQTFLDHRLKLIDLKADVERNEARLQPLIEADTVDEGRISAQLDQMLTARTRLEKANIMMMLSIRKTLSVEQWKKLEAIRQQRERPMWFERHAPGEHGEWGEARPWPDAPGTRHLPGIPEKKRQPTPATRPPGADPPLL